MIKACYVHVPFCKNICSYCDFCKNYYNEKIVDDYLDVLEKEVKNNYKNEVLNTLYVGGGTPSALSCKALNKLFKVLSVFKLNDDYEFTFECNYQDINEDLLKLLKENRINRLSVGIQTFNNKYMNVLNRNIDKEKMMANVKLVKKYFDNINLDLMYALPGETLESLVKDIELFVSLNVEHISTYALIIEDHTRLKMLNVNDIDDDLQAKMYYKIIEILKGHGYEHYEISNFCKIGYESKHNLTYWNNDEYYGFGAGASGFVNGVRYDNTKSIFNYLNERFKVEEELVNEECLIKDEVMLGLRKIKGISKESFKFKYHKQFERVFDYKELLKLGLLKEFNDMVFIPESKLFVSNEIIIKLLDTYIA